MMRRPRKRQRAPSSPFVMPVITDHSRDERTRRGRSPVSRLCHVSRSAMSSAGSLAPHPDALLLEHARTDAIIGVLSATGLVGLASSRPERYRLSEQHVTQQRRRRPPSTVPTPAIVEKSARLSSPLTPRRNCRTLRGREARSCRPDVREYRAWFERKRESSQELLQPCAFSLGLPQHRNVWVRVLPEGEDIRIDRG